MVTAFVDGHSIGPVTDLGQLLADYTAKRVKVDLRDDAGTTLGEIVPSEPICPWEPDLDEAEIERQMAGECFTTEQVLEHLRTLPQ